MKNMKWLLAFVLILPASFTYATGNDVKINCAVVHDQTSALVKNIDTPKTDQVPAPVNKNKKSPLAPKPLLVRVYQNLYRWYFKKDTRDLNERKFDYLNDHDYIQEKRRLDKMGVLRSFFSKEFDTEIFYTATGVPDAQAKIPVVDPKSRALFVYFHGSGTNKASGVNFAYKMNKLAAMGYSAMSMDLPYHAQGSRSPKMNNPDVFYANLKNMIDKYRVPGMPIYLAGHSFGPDIAAEFIKRYPEGEVDGILMISPGSFNEVLEDWFMHNTAHMTALWGDIVSNDDGAAWAGIISSQHQWRKPPTPQSPDPTVINPRLKVHVLSGAWEEYVPGELDERGLPTKTDRDYDVAAAIHEVLAGAKVTIEPGVGHYIFEHTDQNKHDVILRELLAMDDQSLFNEKELKATANYVALPEVQEVARRYGRDPFFKSFVDQAYNGVTSIQEMMASADISTARKMSNDFGRYISSQRERSLAENIKNTATWNTAFYAANQAEIDGIDLKKPRPSDGLLNKYFTMLDQLTPAERDLHAKVSADVYKVPERQAPPAHVLDRQQQKDSDAKSRNPSSIVELWEMPNAA